MIDYDEMNEVLGQVDREFAEKAEKDRREKTVAAEQPEEQPTEQPPEQSYAACMETLRRTKEYIERIQAGVKEKHDEAVKGEESGTRELYGAIYGFALHTIVFPIIYRFLFVLNELIAILCGTVLIFWVFATIKFAKKVLDIYTTWRVMLSKPATEEYAQEFRIPTYRLQKSYCEKRLRLLQDRLTRLEEYEQQIERQQGLSNADCEAMQSLREVPKEPETFSDKTEVTFREFRKWKKQRKK